MDKLKYICKNRRGTKPPFLNSHSFCCVLKIESRSHGKQRADIPFHTVSNDHWPFLRNISVRCTKMCRFIKCIMLA